MVTLASPEQVDIEEALIVTDVEIGLGAIVGDEDLAVLERVHRSGIDVEVWVQLLHGDAEPASDQKVAEAGSRESLPSEEATPPVTKRCFVDFSRYPTGLQLTSWSAIAR